MNVVNKEHPITRGVTASFKITDELYYMTPDTNGVPIEVLAETSPSKKVANPTPLPAGESGLPVSAVVKEKLPEGFRRLIKLFRQSRISMPAFKLCLPNK